MQVASTVERYVRLSEMCDSGALSCFSISPEVMTEILGIGITDISNGLERFSGQVDVPIMGEDWHSERAITIPYTQFTWHCDMDNPRVLNRNLHLQGASYGANLRKVRFATVKKGHLGNTRFDSTPPIKYLSNSKIHVGTTSRGWGTRWVEGERTDEDGNIVHLEHYFGGAGEYAYFQCAIQNNSLRSTKV